MSSRRTRTTSRSAQALSDASNTRMSSRMTAKRERGPADGKLVAGKAAHDKLYRDLEEKSLYCEKEQDTQAQTDRAWLAEEVRNIMRGSRGSTESDATSDPFAFNEGETGDVVDAARTEASPADCASSDIDADPACANPAPADEDKKNTDATDEREAEARGSDDMLSTRAPIPVKSQEELSKFKVPQLREQILEAGWDEQSQGKLYKLRKAQLVKNLHEMLKRAAQEAETGEDEQKLSTIEANEDTATESSDIDFEEMEKQAAEEAQKEEEQAQRDAQILAQLEAEKQVQREAEERAQKQAAREMEEQAQREAEAQAKREAEEQAQREAEEEAKHEAEVKAKREAEEQAKREAEEQARREAEKEAKRAADEEEAKRKAEAELAERVLKCEPIKQQALEHASTAAQAAQKAQQKAMQVVERIQKEDDDRKKKISDAARELRKQKQLEAQCRRAEPHKREAEEHARKAACAAQQAQRHVADLVAKIELAKQAEQAKREACNRAKHEASAHAQKAAFAAREAQEHVADLVSHIVQDKARREAEEAQMKHKEEKKRKSEDGTPGDSKRHRQETPQQPAPAGYVMTPDTPDEGSPTDRWDRSVKFPWAKKAELQAWEAQEKRDPDAVFGRVQTCDLGEIFGQRYKKPRKETGNWSRDGLTGEELEQWRESHAYESESTMASNSSTAQRLASASASASASGTSLTATRPPRPPPAPASAAPANLATGVHSFQSLVSTQPTQSAARVEARNQTRPTALQRAEQQRREQERKEAERRQQREKERQRIRAREQQRRG